MRASRGTGGKSTGNRCITMGQNRAGMCCGVRACMEAAEGVGVECEGW